MGNNPNTLPRLELPKRWELLDQQAAAAGLDPKEFVIRVDSAAERIDKLLERVRTGSGGLMEVIFGLSGSGKTTFLNTLPKFFDKIRVFSFLPTRNLADLPAYIRSTYNTGDDHARVILIERRDNPKNSELEQVEEMFGDLLNEFREPSGRVLVLWPITKKSAAEQIANVAWDVGRDSMVVPDQRGLYEFKGLPRERYYELSDLTTRNLSGDGLEAFGLDEGTAQDLIPSCATIADFYSAVNEYADKKRENTWSVLKERVRARLWVLLPGDDPAALGSTVSALTQGGRNRIDIDKIGEFIDKPENKAIYLAEWKKRRASLAHNLRAIDARLFGVPPTVALAALRLFGDDAVKKLLNQPAVNPDLAKKTMRASRFYKAILAEAGVETTPYAGVREIKQETRDEYNRVQALASKNDKPLNKALGALIAECLREDAPNLVVVTEKRSLPKSQLQPDIQIQIGGAEFICLEPTWRSTRKAGDGKKKGQSTLGEAYLQIYVLEKASQYVKDLDL